MKTIDLRMKRQTAFAGSFLTLFFAPVLMGATFVVDSAGDAGDASPGDGSCATASGSCTLRAAIQEANASAGPDVIEFAIGGGVQSIALSTALPVVTDPVTIDGRTQPGFAGQPLIELDGSTLRGKSHGLTLQSGGNAVYALVINRFSGSGILIGGPGGNVIQGNWIGVDLSGTAAAANKDNGILIQNSPENLIGGTTPEARNVISGNLGLGGLVISGSASRGNLVQGNFIGTNVTGDAAVPNDGRGIAIKDAPDNLVGGTLPGARNLISGNVASGVRVFGGAATGNVVQGNYVGTDVTGKLFIPNSRGLQSRSNGTVFGGSVPEAGNRIAGNTIDGIALTVESNSTVIQNNIVVKNGTGIIIYGGTGHTILDNSIYANSRKGIDLGGNGVTLNDPGDLDGGPNNFQNFPVLTAATTDGATVSVTGTLDSTPDTVFTLQFFTNAGCDPSGYGEGQRLLGQFDVITDNTGIATFSASLPARVPPGQAVTSTATDPAGNTSEFSACVTVTR